MKQTNYKITQAGIRAGAIAGCLIGLFGQVALADLVSGHYKGKIKDARGNKRESAELIVQAAPAGSADGVEGAYAIFVVEPGDENERTSIFQIDELEDQTLVFTRVVDAADGVLVTEQEASYTGQMMGHTLQLNSTPELQKRVNSQFGFEGQLLSSGKSQHLSPLAANVSIRLEGKEKTRAILRTSAHESGHATVNTAHLVGTVPLSVGSGLTMTGDFVLSQVLPGVYVVRFQSLDNEAESGRSLDRKIYGLAIATQGEKSSSQLLLRLVNQGGGDQVSKSGVPSSASSVMEENN